MAKSIESLNVEVQGRKVYVTSTGLRLGAKGKVLGVKEFFSTWLPASQKGLRRAVRKQLDSLGRHDLAHASIHG